MAGELMLKNLADIQLHRLIQRGYFVRACKEEWFRRWKREYPEYKAADGVKRYGK